MRHRLITVAIHKFQHTHIVKEGWHVAISVTSASEMAGSYVRQVKNEVVVGAAVYAWLRRPCSIVCGLNVSLALYPGTSYSSLKSLTEPPCYISRQRHPPFLHSSTKDPPQTAFHPGTAVQKNCCRSPHYTCSTSCSGYVSLNTILDKATPLTSKHKHYIILTSKFYRFSSDCALQCSARQWYLNVTLCCLFSSASCQQEVSETDGAWPLLCQHFRALHCPLCSDTHSIQILVNFNTPYPVHAKNTTLHMHLLSCSKALGNTNMQILRSTTSIVPSMMTHYLPWSSLIVFGA